MTSTITPRPPVTAPSDGGTAPGWAPALLLRLEGLGLVCLSVLGYGHLGAGWWLFAALLLAPDLGLLGYALGPGAGARLYNLTHTLAVPMALGAVGVALAAPTLMAVALVWVTHIGADRAAGFGLKYATGFRDTHLQRVA